MNPVDIVSDRVCTWSPMHIFTGNHPDTADTDTPGTVATKTSLHHVSVSISTPVGSHHDPHPSSVVTSRKVAVTSRHDDPSSVTSADYFDTYIIVGVAGSLVLMLVCCVFLLYFKLYLRRSRRPVQRIWNTSTASFDRQHSDNTNVTSLDAFHLQDSGLNNSSSCKDKTSCFATSDSEVQKALTAASPDSTDRCVDENRCYAFNPVDFSMTTDCELSPQTDAMSDVSEYLATLELFCDVNSNNDDDTLTGRSTCCDANTTASDRSSDESFSRLQSVKAQAAFSPYHLAWGTPRPSRRRSTCHRRQLDLELSHPEMGHGRVGTLNKNVLTDMERVGECEQLPCEDSGAHLSSANTLLRNLTAAYDPDVETEGQENQPLLAYSISEYRSNLKKSNYSLNTIRVPEEIHLFSDSSLDDESFSCNPASFQSDSVIYRIPQPDSDSGPVYSSFDQDDQKATPQYQRHTGSVTLDSTVADVGDINNNLTNTSHGGNDKDGENSTQDALNSSDTGLGSRISHTRSSASPMTLSSAASSSEKRWISNRASNYHNDVLPDMNTCSNIPAKTGGRGDELNGLLALEGQHIRSSSPKEIQSQQFDNIKIPTHLDMFKPCSFMHTDQDTPVAKLPRSKSSTSRPLSHCTLLEPNSRPVRRSVTSESLCSSIPNQQQLILSDISVVSSASQMSLQEDSLMWDNEFAAPVRGTSESLVWDEDPCLETS